MPFIELTDDDQLKLLSLARESIQVQLLFKRDLQIDETLFSPSLQQCAASFVTLRINNKLRGCIGALTATQPLVTDVVQHAASAAFDDPRFPPLTREEEAQIHIEISVLTEPTPLLFSTEEQLLTQLTPGEDGLIIEKGSHRGTFLPTVWRSLPDKTQFLEQLKQKAGLPSTPLDGNTKAWRYHTICFEE